jgi:hypothetical protein
MKRITLVNSHGDRVSVDARHEQGLRKLVEGGCFECVDKFLEKHANGGEAAGKGKSKVKPYVPKNDADHAFRKKAYADSLSAYEAGQQIEPRLKALVKKYRMEEGDLDKRAYDDGSTYLGLKTTGSGYQDGTEFYTVATTYGKDTRIPKSEYDGYRLAPRAPRQPVSAPWQNPVSQDTPLQSREIGAGQAQAQAPVSPQHLDYSYKHKYTKPLVADDMGNGWLNVPDHAQTGKVSGGARYAPNTPANRERYNVGRWSPEDLSRFAYGGDALDNPDDVRAPISDQIRFTPPKPSMDWIGNPFSREEQGLLDQGSGDYDAHVQDSNFQVRMHRIVGETLPYKERLSLEKDAPEKKENGWLGPGTAFAMLGTMGALNQRLSSADYARQYDQLLRRRGMTDQKVRPHNPQNPFGDHTLNAGPGPNFQLNNQTPVQARFQEGGEYEMTEDELRQFLREGGQVEYLD